MSDVGSVSEWEQVARDQEAGRDGCQPMFYMRPVQNTRKSEIEGRAVFDEREYVEIFVPGEKNLRPDRPVQDQDKSRWPMAYAKFEKTREQVTSGTPVDQWPYLNRTRVAEMKANGFLTVESIVNCPDGMTGQLGMDGREVQSRAKQFLQPQGNTETELRAQIAALQTTVKEKEMAEDHMNKRVGALEKLIAEMDDHGDEIVDDPPPKRGPGRPRKHPVAA